MITHVPHLQPARTRRGCQRSGPVSAAPEPLDEVTLEAARTGDRTAWSAVVARYHLVVLAVFLGYSIARPRALELTQDVWLKLYLRAREGLLTVLKVPGLFVREARFRALDELRGVRRSGPMGTLDSVVLEAPSPSAEQQASRRSELAHVRRMLKALPARQRQVLALSGIQGLPHSEVAAQLGITEARARQTLSDARVRLRRMRALPEDVQRAYLLVTVDGLDTAAVAQAMGQTRESVDALLRTAQQQIVHGRSA